MHRLQSLLLSLLLIHNVSKSFCEFRFCHFGPHRFTFQDCPGGVFLNKSVTTSCTFFAQTSNIGDGRVTVNADICDPANSEDADFNADMKTHSFTVAKVQEITFEGDMEPSANATGIDQPITDCAASCFSEWQDPTSLMNAGGERDDDVEPLYTYPTLAPDSPEMAEQQKLTEQLFMNLLLSDGGDDDKKPATSLRVGKLLEASFLVMTSYCPMPYISPTFVRRTLDAFFFFSNNGNKSVRDIGQREFEEIMDVLAQCRFGDTWDSFEILPQECAEDPTIRGAVVYPLLGSSKSKQILLKTAAIDHLDPFIEASWQAISFINAQCFRFNTPQFSLHHIYEVAMEALFTEYILLRWANPPKLTNPSFWNNVMGTRNFQVEMQNVNACARLAYVSNPYIKRMERPFKKVNGTDSDGAPVAPVGWQGTEEDYWEEYGKRGGFRAIVTALGGKCYQHSSEREMDKQDRVEKCSQEEISSTTSAAN